MQSNNTPTVKDLVLIGGGHSHIAVLKRFGMKPMPGIRITLITRDVHTPYSGMLPGHVAGHYDYDESHIDLRPLAMFAGARLFHSRAESIDPSEGLIHCDNRPPVGYDALSINIGSRPAASHIPGADTFALPVKPIDRFLTGWQRIVDGIQPANGQFTLVIVGGGAGGVEMALATQYRLRSVLAENGLDDAGLAVHLISDSPQLLSTHNARVRARFERVLQQRGIHVHTGTRVAEVQEDGVLFSDGQRLACDKILWVTNASPQPWPQQSGLATDTNGFIEVDDCLQSLSYPNVFAAGDIAAVVNHPREKSGVFAVRQGPPLSDNLRRFLAGKPTRKFVPQKEFLGLISTGDQYAVASRSHWSIEGAWVWRIKDWIDRSFMRKFADLPEMQTDTKLKLADGIADDKAIKELSAIAMRCGGCGAKVGSTVLSRVINRLNTVERDDVVMGLNSPDDSAVLSVPEGKLMVQSVDYFRSFIDDPYVFGRIAANHALGDVFAMGAEAQSALAIATLPYGREAVVEDTLYQVMSGALEVLDDCNAALVGGHSSEGAELAFGLTVNGVIEAERMLRKGGMQAGQVLILTKGIGTGTLLAADMRYKARGRWVHGAIDSMLLSNRRGSEILMEYGTTACTDVTGFGLLGHLVEMTRASNVDAEIDLEAIPVLRGAIATIEAGVFSSLQPQNVRLRRAIKDTGLDRTSARYSLLFDPQTAGGLLATVPAERADACLEALRQTGYVDSVVIGRVVESGDDVESIRIY